MESVWTFKLLKQHCIASQVIIMDHTALGGSQKTLVNQSIFADSVKSHKMSFKIMIPMSVVHSVRLKLTTQL